MRGYLVLAVLCAAGAAGCDTRAKASDPVKPEQLSKEYETCSASAQCAEGLRCFDHQCLRTARSSVGDYFAALGATHLKQGHVEEAIDAYNRALGHYDTAKLAVPADVDCGYGAALAAGKAKKDHAELGARVLHRCVLALPAGGAMRERAFLDLASLDDAGLDPLALGRSQLADVYLTRAPSAPSTDKLGVTVAASPTPAGKSYQLIPDRLNEADMKTGLVNCWTQYNNTTHKDALAVTLPVKASYTPSDYDDEPGSYSVKLEAPAGLAAGSPEATADACARAIVEPVLKELKIRDAFTTRLTITVK